MKASAMYDDYYSSNLDSAVKTYTTFAIIGTIIGVVFWCTIIYCCIRACRKVAEKPKVVQVYQNEQQQPQIHYIVHQEALGPNGQPTVYQQAQSGQYPAQYVQQSIYAQNPSAISTTTQGVVQGTIPSRIV